MQGDTRVSPHFIENLCRTARRRHCSAAILVRRGRLAADRWRAATKASFSGQRRGRDSEPACRFDLERKARQQGPSVAAIRHGGDVAVAVAGVPVSSSTSIRDLLAATRGDHGHHRRVPRNLTPFSLLSRVVRQVRRIFQALPLDASCLARDQPEAVRIRRFINQARWRGVPAWSAAFLRPVAHVLWLLWCPVATTQIALRQGAPVLGRAWRKGVVNGWWYGRLAYTDLVALPFTDAAVMKVGHLDDHHWLLLWSVLASRADMLLARDKLALAARIAALGARVPALLGEISQGAAADVAALPWQQAAILFIKPRHGARAIGASSVERLTHPWYRVNGTEVVHCDVLTIRLTRLARTDALLVQAFQRPAPAASDLACDAPIELRLTTARLPGAEAFVLSCLMKVQPPGSHATTTLTGALAVPVNPQTGIMHSGIFLHDPGQQYLAVPWNGAVIRGRTVPDYQHAATMVIAASEALPGLPVIGWDVLITDAGPVILEANASLSWWFTHLWHALTGTPSPLLQIVSEWLDLRETPRHPPVPEARRCDGASLRE
jgi:hypothetical protein